MEKTLTLPEILELTTVSYPTIRRWLNAGTFPQPLNERGKKLLWSKSQLEAWANRHPPPITTPTVTSPAQSKRQNKEKQQRLAEARKRLEMHRKSK